MNHFFDKRDNEKATPENINRYTDQFLKDVACKALALMEYCYRLTLYPGDVARALDMFAEVEGGNDALVADESISALESMMDDEKDDEASNATANPKVMVRDIETLRAGVIQLQARVRGASVRSHELLFGDANNFFSDDEISVIDSTVYDLHNTSCPAFDYAYPAVETIYLSDEQFRRDVLLRAGFENSAVPFHHALQSEGHEIIVSMLKRASYAFIVKKLS